jgi:hypothetical protein
VLPFDLSTRLSIDSLAADLAKPRLALSDLRLTRSTAAVDERATLMGPDRARHAHERPELPTGLADDAAEDSGFRPGVRFPTAIDPPYRLLAESLPVSCSVLAWVFHCCSPPSIPAVAPCLTVGCCGFTGPGPSAAPDGPREHSQPSLCGARGHRRDRGRSGMTRGSRRSIDAAVAGDQTVCRRDGLRDCSACPIPALAEPPAPEGVVAELRRSAPRPELRPQLLAGAGRAVELEGHLQQPL